MSHGKLYVNTIYPNTGTKVSISASLAVSGNLEVGDTTSDSVTVVAPSKFETSITASAHISGGLNSNIQAGTGSFEKIIIDSGDNNGIWVMGATAQSARPSIRIGNAFFTDFHIGDENYLRIDGSGTKQFEINKDKEDIDFVVNTDTVDDAFIITSSFSAGGATFNIPVTASNATITNLTASNLTVTDLTATRINTTEITSSFITSSIIVTEGSNVFGDTDADTHKFNGAITASSHISASGDLFVNEIGPLGSSKKIKWVNNNTYILGADTALTLDGDDIINFYADQRIIFQPGANVGIHTDNAVQPAALTVRGDISSSGFISTQTNITASGHISASGNIFGHNITITGSGATGRGTGSFGNVQVERIKFKGKGLFDISTNNTYEFTNSSGGGDGFKMSVGGNKQTISSEGAQFRITSDDEGLLVDDDFTSSGDFLISGSATEANLDVRGNTIMGSLAANNGSGSRHLFNGHITASGAISASGNVIGKTGSFSAIMLQDYASIIGSPNSLNTRIELGNDDNWRIRANTTDDAIQIDNGGVTINPQLASGLDFEVNTNTKVKWLTVDAQDERLGIGGPPVNAIGSTVQLFGDITVTGSTGHITASGNISSSGDLFVHNLTSVDSGSFNQMTANMVRSSYVSASTVNLSNSLRMNSAGGDATILDYDGGLRFGFPAVQTLHLDGASITLDGPVTASGYISASGDIIGNRIIVNQKPNSAIATSGATTHVISVSGSTQFSAGTNSNNATTGPHGAAPLALSVTGSTRIGVSNHNSHKFMGHVTMSDRLTFEDANSGIDGNIDITGNITGSGNLRISKGIFATDMTASSDISASGTITANSFAGHSSGMVLTGNITASGDISASRVETIQLTSHGNSMATFVPALTSSLYGSGVNFTLITGKGIKLSGPVTASSHISASGDITTTGNVSIFGTVSANDGVSITYETASSAGKTQGDIVKFGNFTTVAGAIYAFTGSTWSKAHSGSNGGASSSIAIAVGTNSTTHGMLLRGFTQLGNDPGGPNGAPLYIEAPGSASVTPTGTTGHVARVIGYHYGARQVYFNPDNTWIVV